MASTFSRSGSNSSITEVEEAPQRGYFDGVPAGIGSSLIPNSRLSCSDSSDTAEHSRLHGAQAWAPRTPEASWLQVDLEVPHLLTGIETQGGSDGWTTGVHLSISLDNQTWTPLMGEESSKTPVLYATNWDSDTVTQHHVTPCVARYVRIEPVTWQRQLNLRWELLVKSLGRPLGIQASNRVTDAALTASSSRDDQHQPKASRFNGLYCWVPSDSDETPFLQVDMRAVCLLNAVIVQACPPDGRVTGFRLFTSLDGHKWAPYSENGREVEFDCTYDSAATIGHSLRSPRFCQHVRICPTECIDAFAVRWEVMVGVKTYPVGLQSGLLSSGCILSSSTAKDSYQNNARAGSATAWRAASNNERQWLQVDLEQSCQLAAFLLQGDAGLDACVTSLTLEHSFDGQTWQSYTEGGKVRVFAGNKRGDSSVVRVLWTPVVARYIRFRPSSWLKTIAMRVEVFVVSIGEELGVASGSIRASQMSVSSSTDESHGASSARLLGSSCWVADCNGGDCEPFLEFDLDEPALLTAVACQGDPGSIKRHVSQLAVDTTVDLKWPRVNQVDWQSFSMGDTSLQYEGTSHNAPLRTAVFQPRLATRARICPTAWQQEPAMRVELFSMPAGLPVGLGSSMVCTANVQYSSLQTEDSRDASQSLGHLNGEAWRPSSSDASPYLQINLNTPCLVKGAVIQSSPDGNDGVTEFEVHSSLDSYNFVPYCSSGPDPDRFLGTTPDVAEASCAFKEPLIAQYIRIVPIAHHGAGTALRADLYTSDLGSVVGLSHGRFSDQHFSASSSAAENCAATGRLGGTGAWTPDENDKSPFWQVDLGREAGVTAVLTQGQSRSRNWVSEYEVHTSLDGNLWTRCSGKATTKLFLGNTDNSTVVGNVLPKTQLCRYVRIVCKSWRYHPALRVELMAIDCGMPAGLSNGNIPPAKVCFSDNDVPNKTVVGRLGGLPWTPSPQHPGWMEVDLDDYFEVTAIVVEGSESIGWLDSFSLDTSVDGVHWEHTTCRTYCGTDRGGHAALVLKPGLQARHVRLQPLSWSQAPCVHFELYVKSIGKAFLGRGAEEAIQDDSIQLSTATDSEHSVAACKLGSDASWMPAATDPLPTMTVDLRRPVALKAVHSTGDDDAGARVTTFFCECSVDGSQWYRLPVRYGTSASPGAVVAHKLPDIVCQYVRILPVSWQSRPAMAVELFGVSAEVPVGIHNHRIPDDQLSALEPCEPEGEAKHARLLSTKCWKSASSANGTIVVDIGRECQVRALSIQGDGADNWIKRFRVSGSCDGEKYEPIHGSGDPNHLNFDGNSNATAIVTQTVAPTRARFVRIQSIDCHGTAAARIEVFRAAELGDEYNKDEIQRLLQPTGLDPLELNIVNSDLDHVLLNEAVERVASECRRLSKKLAADTTRAQGLNKAVSNGVDLSSQLISDQKQEVAKAIPSALRSHETITAEAAASLEGMIKRLGDLPSDDTILRFDTASTELITSMQASLSEVYSRVEGGAEGVFSTGSRINDSSHTLLSDLTGFSRDMQGEQYLSDEKILAVLAQVTQDAVSTASNIGCEDETQMRLQSLCAPLREALQKRTATVSGEDHCMNVATVSFLTTAAGLGPCSSNLKQSTDSADQTLRGVFSVSTSRLCVNF